MSNGMTERVFHASSEVPEQGTVHLGSFVSSCYERIRVLAVGSMGDDSGEVELTLSLCEEQGTPGPLDRVLIGPWGTFTRVYEVPGMMVGVSVRAPSAAATVGVYVWGRREIGEGLVLDPEARAVRDAG
ncbi:MAG: hypothetical protein IPJ14_19360 [Kineosporiaceae bacterium]|nr:hypothetical protein [Kineosporiaceae bacterium]MBK7624746.1 hypothetical protein [Kineosporiaceae bacterium]